MEVTQITGSLPPDFLESGEGVLNLILYGERGLVNGLVLDIKQDINLIRGFLEQIKFAGGYKPTWIDNVTAAKFWIEPSFGQFGNPDLIIICQCGGGDEHVVFLEAKVVPYADSAVPLNGKPFPGLNSCINAQLTLRYRFVQAFKNSSYNGKIREKDKMWEAYSNWPTDANQKQPRALGKSSRARHIVKDLFGGATKFWFVALTEDRSSVIDPFTPDKRPLILDDSGNEIWATEKNYFGIITYEQLDGLLPPGYYQSVRGNGSSGKVAQKHTGVQLKTVKWDSFDAAINIVLRKCLQDTVENAIDGIYGRGTGLNWRRTYVGSDSYLYGGKNTIIKLIPYSVNGQEVVMVAVLQSLTTAAGVEGYFPLGPFNIGVGAHARMFVAHQFLECSELDECSLALSDILGVM